jgi:PKD repeat protein
MVMKIIRCIIVGGVLVVASALKLWAATLYVSQDSPAPAPPYTDWATAATNIQQAIDAAAAGDEIVVTNGIFTTGGRAVYGSMTNRVTANKPLKLRSVNGPQYTIIHGYQVPGATNGDGAIRCVYLANGASLSGFTLTNGATGTSWDAYRREISGGGVWCESTNAVATNCVIAGNSADAWGGGAYGGTLRGCTLDGNSAGNGGGASDCILYHCTLANNSAGSYGGGVCGGAVYSSTLRNNSGDDGGGAAEGGTLDNCVLTDNSARASGGGASGCTLRNCTLTGNSAAYGGGAYGCTANNSIIYFNEAYRDGENHSDSALNYCCTMPLPASGLGNITPDPQLASASHLSVTSPCRGAGSTAYATGVDIDGEPWAVPASIGCDEVHAAALTGPLSVRLRPAYTNVTAGFPVGLEASIEGRPSASQWDFGDGVVVSNRPYATHTWDAPGDYAVILRAYNENHPEGEVVRTTIQVVSQPVHYVAADSRNPRGPFTSWTTAAKSIQEAVNAATIPGALILVTNGEYATGSQAVNGSMQNRVVVDKPVVVRSVNGPQFTFIRGAKAPGGGNGNGAVRCMYLAKGASLSGFTLTGGATHNNMSDWEREQAGGGVWVESVTTLISNCVITGNSAEHGGGLYMGKLRNCTLTLNSARSDGGGIEGGVLQQCTLSGNSAESGGGAYQATLDNCTLTANTARYGGGASGGNLTECTLAGNSASEPGGGVYQSTLINCKLNNNSAQSGGGASGCTLNNCAVSGNSARDYGGGANGGTLNNCTLTGNSAGCGGGVYGANLNNCIVYFNPARNGANHYASSLNFCCTTPLPGSGVGNISIEPQLASASHLSSTSPCRGAGSAAYAIGADIDGETWADPPAMGCDEIHAGLIAGPLSVAVRTTYTNVTVGFPVSFIASIEGPATASAWHWADGTVVSNWPFATQAWNVPGDYTVILRAYNDSHTEGVCATQVVHVVAQPVHYVSQFGSSPAAPYTSWSTAAKNIQDAVDAATVPGALVLVTNGIYATGGRVVGTSRSVNRVVVERPVLLRSVNGPQLTFIQGSKNPGNSSGNGDGAVRCVYLAKGASLSGFTLTNGATGAADSWIRDDLERCGGGVWCDSLSVLVSNCVLLNNSAWSGGGAYRGTLNNCTLTGNYSAEIGAGSYAGQLTDCALTRNTSSNGGGGAYGGTLNNCTLTSNSAGYGAGACQSQLTDCALTGNTATDDGGGAYYSTLTNCSLDGNFGNEGGGAASSTLTDCALNDNTACYRGGGAYDSRLHRCTLRGNTARSGGGVCQGGLNNCALFINRAAEYGGGAFGGTLNNCTLTGNSAESGGGGTGGGTTLNNCIVCFNAAPKGTNHFEASLNYCCTTPLPSGGIGNITLDPQLANPSHLSSISPCRGAGSVAGVAGTDIDGEAWITPPSIGCDEFYGGPRTGPLSVAMEFAYTNAAPNFPVELRAIIEGRTSGSKWEFGDGVVVSNRVYEVHSWTSPGDYRVTITAYNDDHPEGVSATETVHISLQSTLYVAAGNIRPVAPYTSWSGAAANIQDAVEAARWVGGSYLVLVSNGVYSLGGRTVDRMITNRVAVTRPLALQSVNGPQFTFINGDGGVRCVYLAAGASLSGFTLTNGTTQIAATSDTERTGGGVSCESMTATVSNCVLKGNAAQYGGGAFGGTLKNCAIVGNAASSYGGGAYGGTLTNCVLADNSAVYSGGGCAEGTLYCCAVTGNSARWGGGTDNTVLKNCIVLANTASEGGGVYKGALSNCTVSGNSATWGAGGVAGGTFYNCIVYQNNAPNGPNYLQDQWSGPLSYSCTTPLPTNGIGNITNAPRFLDYAGGNLRLQSNSPCINAGNNAYAPGPNDLDGNARIFSGTVDIGAYEFQGSGSAISHAWLQQYGLPMDGSADRSDLDADGMNNWQEWRCLTDPTDSASALRVLSAVYAGSGVNVTWQSAIGVNYILERSTDLSRFTTVAAGIPGKAVITSFTDTRAPDSPCLFYRVRVQN